MKPVFSTIFLLLLLMLANTSRAIEPGDTLEYNREVYTVLRVSGAGGESIVYKIKNDNNEVLALKSYKTKFNYILATSNHSLIEKVIRINAGSSLAPIFSGIIKVGPEVAFVEIFPYFDMTLYDLKYQEFFVSPRMENSAKSSQIIHNLTDIAIQFYRLLDALYLAQVNHLDINPSNIGTRSSQSYSLGVFLIDWGMASPDEGILPRMTDSPIGTARYSSPERFLGNAEPLSVWSEYYSMALVLFELATNTEFSDFVEDEYMLGNRSESYHFRYFYGDTRSFNSTLEQLGYELDDFEYILLKSLPEEEQKQAKFLIAFVRTFILAGLQRTPYERINYLLNSPFKKIVKIKEPIKNLQIDYSFNLPRGLNSANIQTYFSCKSSLEQFNLP